MLKDSLCHLYFKMYIANEQMTAIYGALEYVYYAVGDLCLWVGERAPVCFEASKNWGYKKSRMFDVSVTQCSDEGCRLELIEDDGFRHEVFVPHGGCAEHSLTDKYVKGHAAKVEIYYE